MWELSSDPTIEPQSVYYEKSFGKIYERLYKAKQIFLNFSSQEKKLSLSLLSTTLPDGSFEIRSPYGYGGFFGCGSLNEYDIKSLQLFLKSKGYLCLFIRHSPFNKNSDLLPKSFVELNRMTFSINLEDFRLENNEFEGVNKKFRRSIRNAIKHNLVGKCQRLGDNKCDLDNFIQIYNHTMKRNQASNFYFFDQQYFEDHKNLLNNNAFLVTVELEAKLIAGAIFLTDKNKIVHYHLGGSLPIHHSMEFLFYFSSRYFWEKGFSKMHIGGGNTLEGTDGLSKFKQKLTNISHDYHCTKLICDSRKYLSLRKKMNLEGSKYFLIGEALENE